MEIAGLSDMTWISIIAAVACLGFGTYMIMTGKPGFVRGFTDNSSYRDKEQYSKKGGKLLLMLGAACVIMGVLSFINTLASNILGIAALIVFGFFWKKMSDEFGPV